MTMQACIFPAELLLRILYHTDIRDIFRWRTVSKWFCDITYDTTLWKTLYANAPFPCPPGPSPSQSAASLERTLVRSAQLAQTWTTQPMRDVSTVRIQTEGKTTIPPRLIRGRWFVSCESRQRLVLHDVDAGAETHHARQVLWEYKVPVVLSWDVCSMTSSIERQCVVYVLLKFKLSPRYPTLPHWKLLELRLNDESGKLYDLAAVDSPVSQSNELGVAHLQGGKSPFLFIRAKPRSMVFDTRTRVLYELPEFRVALAETLGRAPYNNDPRDRYFVFTDTALILFSYLNSRDHPIVVQVFTRPPDGSPVKNGIPVLRLTHEGTVDCRLMRVDPPPPIPYEGITEFRPLNLEVLKSSVDHVTGTTNVVLLEYSCRGDLRVTRIDLTLPESTSASVSPMTIELQHIDFPEDVVLTWEDGHCFQCIDVSNKGHMRGFSWATPRVRMGPYPIMKFTIDTTQEQWVVTCGKVLAAEWNRFEDTLLQFIMFDGIRGRICFADPTNYYKTVVVVDIE